MSGLISRIGEWYGQMKDRGFVRYVGKSVFWIVLVYMLLVLAVYLTGRYLVDFNGIFRGVINHLSDKFVILLFFASESFTGLVPVDLFVVWTQKFGQPLPYLALLGVLSYTGGVISYQIGRWILHWPKVRAYTERRMAVYIDFVKKWGGAFIVIAALFPFTPFSLVVIAVSLLEYPFRPFLFYALARLARFVLQGFIFFNLLNVDSWVI
jgi:membrane protein YqaA with SNARE-associated domain